jgi:DNA-binding NarL/FixJ family response regulator
MSEHVFTGIDSLPTMAFRLPGMAFSPAGVDPGRAREALRLLSRREREILPLLAARWTDREIADALCISYRTVTTHVSHIFDKLGINARREVVAFALAAEDAFV